MTSETEVMFPRIKKPGGLAAWLWTDPTGQAHVTTRAARVSALMGQGVAVEPLFYKAARDPDRPGAVTRAELIALIMDETTDNIVEDGIPIDRPNVIVQGCRFVRVKERHSATDGYENPERAAQEFAGFIADRILDRMTAPLPTAPTDAAPVQPDQTIVDKDEDDAPEACHRCGGHGTLASRAAILSGNDICHDCNGTGCAR